MKNHDSLEHIASILRRDVIDMLYHAGSGHPGGSLSSVDIIASLYFGSMRHDPKNPSNPKRDKFILAKGHAAPALYAALARSGYFPVEEYDNLRRIGSMLQGHPSSLTTPGVEVSTGSLGQGLSIGIGFALADRLDGHDSQTYVLLGDGELQEGQVWEAAMGAAHYGLGNLCAIVDRNRLQIDGNTEDVMALEPLRSKWSAFGWQVHDIDGHDFAQINDALSYARETLLRPSVIIANTVKGKGVSFMEGQAGWHGNAPGSKEYLDAIGELDEAIENSSSGKKSFHIRLPEGSVAEKKRPAIYFTPYYWKGSMVATREAYGSALENLAIVYDDIVALDADLSGSTKSALFGKRFPERFFNAGIAEQNLIGMPAGLAAAGKVPFASTFAVFS